MSSPHHRARTDVTEAEFIGGAEKRELVIHDYDPRWPRRFEVERDRIAAALGAGAVGIEHIGSTSVPGLAAKPIVDVLVTVRDITDESAYVDPLVSAGYELRVREPGHRMLRTPARDVHIHVLEPDDPAGHDYLLLRDQLRRDEGDRRLYERTKRRLVQHDWPDMNAYADAKSDVIEAIKARARSQHPQ